jgi:cellulose synthase/poly-beta-1,6-N-acetylglucosamine synthase-like glycosyltransferase
MIALFCLSLLLLVYPLFIYPLLLELFHKRRLIHSLKQDGVKEPPTVSILLSVYNEAANIQAKMDNFLALDYPPEKIELLVISDGSDDGTDDLVRERAQTADGRIRLLRQEGRLGKTSALNLAATEALGEVLFFTDADSMLAPDCVKRLALPLLDPVAGLASGRSIYRDEAGNETTGSLYRRFEEWQKEREGSLFGIPGADGAGYALKKELYKPLPPEYINDLLHPLQTALAGQKALALPGALIYEAASETNSKSEFARQTRIMAQAWLIFLRFFLPLAKAGRWGFLWQFVSHKTLRWLALPWLALMTLSAVFLLPAAFPALALVCLAALILSALLGLGNKGGFAGRVSLLFILQSAAALNGLYRLARGNKFVTWKPRGN